MKQRPILFNGAMVRALLDGSKTQTRRLFKVHGWTTEQMSKYEFVDVLQASETGELTLRQPATEAYAGFKLSANAKYPAYFKCPFGTIGGQLWVRENFQPFLNEDCDGDMRLANWKTGENYHCSYPANDGIHEFLDWDDNLRSSVKPSIHMPRWASRITLEITSVRIERLNDISKKDAAAEGFTKISKDDGKTWKYGIPDRDGLPGTDDSGWPWRDWEQDPRNAFKKLWESINGDGSWDANPWLWVIEFKRVTA